MTTVKTSQLLTGDSQLPKRMVREWPEEDEVGGD
jgi:hypothetical protein